VDITELGALIQKLKEAIDPSDGSLCSLYKVENTGYTPFFLTDSKRQYENFISVHQNISEKQFEDLRQREIKYAKTLKDILHGGRYLEACRMRSKPIATIYAGDINKPADSYNMITNVVGIVSEMGSPDFKRRTHVFLDGYDYKIYTTNEQDEILKQYYRKQLVTIKIKQKKSIKSDRVISANLISISPKTPGNFVENIKTLSTDDLSFLNKAQTHEDILNLIRT
jgi:hypothetical protein